MFNLELDEQEVSLLYTLVKVEDDKLQQNRYYPAYSVMHGLVKKITVLADRVVELQEDTRDRDW